MSEEKKPQLPAVRVRDGQVFASSRDVADQFGKRHADVLRAIDGLDCSPEFSQRNFASWEVPHPTVAGRTIRAFEMTKDGFAFLAMGFTGEKAARFKEAYITAFNAMADELQRGDAPAGLTFADKMRYLEFLKSTLDPADIRSAARSFGLPVAEPASTQALPAPAGFSPEPAKTFAPASAYLVQLPPDEDARACLERLLEFTVSSRTVRFHIDRAMKRDVSATATLKHTGITVKDPDFPGEDGFLIWTRSRKLQHVYLTTHWDRYRWVDALALLPGAVVRLDQDSATNKAATRETLFIPLTAITPLGIAAT